MKKSTVIIIWGLITAIAMCSFYLSLYLTNSMGRVGIVYLVDLILFAGLQIGVIQYRNKANGGYATFGELYKATMLITLVLTIFIAVYYIIFLQLAPDYLLKVKEVTMAQAQARLGNQEMSQEQKELSEKIFNAVSSPTVMVLSTIVSNLLGGAILGLIVSAIGKKTKPQTQEEENVLH
jgi:hypothetical protein